MDLQPYVDNLHQQLVVAAETGGQEARDLVERLASPLDAAIRLTLQDALAAAAEEITCELAPGSVELRLRGREPEFVVTTPPAAEPLDLEPASPALVMEGEDGAMSRINFRLSDQLKSRVEQAAAAEGLSVNAWLVRAASAAVDRIDSSPRRERRSPTGAQRYTGWAR
jgi:hypothetical protein